MPMWLYEIRPLYAALILVALIEVVSLIGLMLARRFIVPRLHYHEGVNDAVSGTVQAIGVFYGITVGLIAVGVWNTNSEASDLVSKEATAISSLYRDVSGYPQPIREELRSKLREYTVFVINEAWPAQKKGINVNTGAKIIDDFQTRLYTFEPTGTGQSALHSETLRGFNQLLDARRMRNIAVDSGLSSVMWAVIWVGAAISIAIAYFYRIEDLRLHSILIGLMSGFLAMLLFMIVINDKPFYGYVSVSSDPYKQVLERVIDLSRE
jgi:hypothetical protein